MKTVYERCCGIDVHKKIMIECLYVGRKRETREFGTSTQDLRNLAEWLIANGCQIAAMERTGSYWKPVHNVLKVLGKESIVVNAHHIKKVPGRKTDTKDSERIAQHLQCGLLKASYFGGLLGN